VVRSLAPTNLEAWVRLPHPCINVEVLRRKIWLGEKKGKRAIDAAQTGDDDDDDNDDDDRWCKIDDGPVIFAERTLGLDRLCERIVANC